MLGRHLAQCLNWVLGCQTPLPCALHTVWGSSPRLGSSLLPLRPQLSLHLQPSPPSGNADACWTLHPDISWTCPEAALLSELTPALPDLPFSAAGTATPETQVSSSSSFSLLIPSSLFPTLWIYLLSTWLSVPFSPSLCPVIPPPPPCSHLPQGSPSSTQLPQGLIFDGSTFGLAVFGDSPLSFLKVQVVSLASKALDFSSLLALYPCLEFSLLQLHWQF